MTNKNTRQIPYEQTAFLPLQHGHQPGGSPVRR